MSVASIENQVTHRQTTSPIEIWPRDHKCNVMEVEAGSFNILTDFYLYNRKNNNQF